MSERTVLLEVCVDSVEAAAAAQEGGADRVELCADLLEGGITPSDGTIALARRLLHIPINVLVRPRGGDFCYSGAEYDVMRLDIERCKALGVNGVVIGILHAGGTVDRERCAALIELARPLSVTFHRAFDMTADPCAALEDVIAIGADRILTSGQEATTTEGRDLIAELVRQAGERIIIMAGGGINARNLAKFVAATGVREVHATARRTVESPMQYRNPNCFMGGVLRPPEYALAITDPERVRGLLAALG